MLSLLPKEIQSKVVKEYKRRRLIVFLGAVCALGIIALITSAPSYILSIIKDVYAGTEASNATEIDPTQVQELNSVLNKVRRQSDFVIKNKPENITGGVLSNVFKQAPSGVKINNIVYSIDEKTGFTLSVSGIATNRESLLTFARLLEQTEIFAEVTVPPSSFTKDKDIDFTLRLLKASKKQQ